VADMIDHCTKRVERRRHCFTSRLCQVKVNKKKLMRMVTSLDSFTFFFSSWHRSFPLSSLHRLQRISTYRKCTTTGVQPSAHMLEPSIGVAQAGVELQRLDYSVR
jgi:hypothetical protein